jgi:hypothetical protein
LLIEGPDNMCVTLLARVATRKLRE